METLEGHATQEFHDLSMEVDGGTRRSRSGDELGLGLADGRHVRLSLADARLVPNVDARDSFDSLLDSELALPFLEHAPADDAAVRIHGTRIEPGAAVVARGTVDYDAASGDGYRDANPVPSSMEVQALAIGADARAAIEQVPLPRSAVVEERPRVNPAAMQLPPAAPRSEPREVPLTLPIGILAAGVLAALGGVAALVVGDLDAPGAATAIVGVHLLVIGLFVWRRRRFLPEPRTPTEDLTGLGKRTALGIRYGTLFFVSTALAGLCAGLLWDEAFRSQTPLAFALTALVSLVSLTCLVGLAVRERRAFARLGKILAAPARVEPNRWAALDGEVVGGGYRRERTHEARRDTYEDVEGRTWNRRWYVYRDSVEGDTLEVSLPGRQRARVRLADGLIATARITEDGDVLTEAIELGDVVRVVGRPAPSDDGWEVASTGDGTLYVFASPSGSAAGAIRRARALHVLGLIALALMTLTALGLGALAMAA